MRKGEKHSDAEILDLVGVGRRENQWAGLIVRLARQIGRIASEPRICAAPLACPDERIANGVLPDAEGASQPSNRPTAHLESSRGGGWPGNLWREAWKWKKSGGENKATAVGQ